MEMKHSLHQRMTQTLQLNQQMIAALELLELPIQELELRIKEEVTQNPVLEFDDDVSDEADADTPLPTAEVAPPEPEQPERVQQEQREQEERREEIDWSDFVNDDLDTRGSYGQEFDPSAEFLERVPVASIGLADHLSAQLRLAVSDERQLEVGEYIIGSIDDRGFLASTVDEIAAEMPATPDEVLAMLAVIQTFEPAGVGARDLPECLLLQLAARDESGTLQARIIRERFHDLSERRYPDIARAFKVDVTEVQAAADAIARLNPRPGAEYSTEAPKYVTPDLVVDRVGDKFVVQVNDRNLPRLRINATYESVLRTADKDSQTRKYVNERLNSAKWLIDTIEHRRRTIVRVMECIVDIQQEFFEKGIAALRPLTLQQVAQEVEVHESTVSRVTKGKYAQTPRGVFELKFFFSGGITTDDGEDISSKAVKQEVARLVAEEDPASPLSDQQIAERLKEQGMEIARRTVAKYRDQLRILPARSRRRYDGARRAAGGSGAHDAPGEDES